MAGISILPRAATVAGPEPDMAPQNRVTTMEIIPRPPGTGPVNNRANAIIRLDIPDFSIIKPAKMKNGTANSVYFERPALMVSRYIPKGMPYNIIVMMVDNPSETAIGIFISTSRKNKIRRMSPISIFKLSHLL
jgi:hypothetical protein